MNDNVTTYYWKFKSIKTNLTNNTRLFRKYKVPTYLILNKLKHYLKTRKKTYIE